MRCAARLKRISARIHERQPLRFDGILSLYQVEGCGPGAIACGRVTACGPKEPPGRGSRRPLGVGLPLGVSASADAARPPMLSRSRRRGRTHARPPCRRSAHLPGGALAHATNRGMVVQLRHAARHCVRRFASEAWAQGPCARRSLSLAAVGGCGTSEVCGAAGQRPALDANVFAHKAQNPFARRPSPSPPTRGGARQTRPPAPVAPGQCGAEAPVARGQCGASPRVCLGSSAAWGASRRSAPQWGALSAGRAHGARFLCPPCGCGCGAYRGFLPTPPRPSPTGPRGARGHDRLRAGTRAAHIGPRPSSGQTPTRSAIGRTRHTRGNRLLRVATSPLLTSCPVSGKIPLRGHTGSVRSTVLLSMVRQSPPS